MMQYPSIGVGVHPPRSIMTHKQSTFLTLSFLAAEDCRLDSSGMCLLLGLLAH